MMYTMSNNLFISGEISEIEKLEIHNPLIMKNYVWVHYTLASGISDCSCIIGEKGTYIMYNDEKYESENDYYRLQSVLENEKIKKMLERL